MNDPLAEKIAARAALRRVMNVGDPGALELLRRLEAEIAEITRLKPRTRCPGRHN